ncbi:hypothetical protein O2K51_06780 [Apibacter raozihei]|uniref:EF-Tu C-terminal domain-related protein n=1 Tax=Apibacter raozihei TaxID=2500547 RepID=UPI000FE2EED1|nr:hypothetical protein [Apibacter raozihei]
MKKKFRDITVKKETYEWQFLTVIRIKVKNNSSYTLTVDIGWYDVWLYINSLPPDDCELWQVTPQFVHDAIIFALDNGWKKRFKQLSIKYKNKMFLFSEKNNKLPDLEAEIYYFKEEEGGRKTAIANGYRGQFFYNDKDWDAPQNFINKETCQPGESIKVFLTTLNPVFHFGNFFMGKTFLIREGNRTVGKGKITRILNPEFEIPEFEEKIITAINEFPEEYLEPLTFLNFLIKTEKYSFLSRHFFNSVEDLQNTFQEMEKQAVLIRISESLYIKL